VTKVKMQRPYAGTETRNEYMTGWDVSTLPVGQRDAFRTLQATRAPIMAKTQL
jgi:hypothetical protein